MYNDVFGGGSINPSQRTYLDLTISADVVLQWPIEQQIGGDDVAVDIIDVDGTVPGLNIDFGDARQVSTGYTTLFTNIGGVNTVTIRDSAGGTIISLIPGVSFFIYLTDNTTSAGVWRSFQLGALMTAANAALLAGAGLKAITTTLNQTIPPTSTAVTPVTLVDADRAQMTIWTGGVGTLNLPTPGSIGSDWFTYIRNGGSGVLTITPPAGTVDGASSLSLNPGVSGIFVTDGTDFFTIGLTSSLVTGFDFIEVNVAGSGDFVLSGVQLDRVAYRFIGALTGNRKIVVPNTIQEYWVDNSTTGAFILEVATAAQVTPVGVTQGGRAILYCDGTNVLNAESSAVAFPISVAQGGTGATTAAGARTNLGVPPTTLAINAGLGLTGDGTLAADVTLDVGAGDGIAANADDVTVDIPGLTVAAAFSYLNDDFMIWDLSAGALRKVRGSVFASRTVMLATPISIAFGGDDTWATITDGTLVAADATIAIIRGWAQINPSASGIASQVIHLRQTGSAIAKANSNRMVNATAEDAAGQGSSADTNVDFVSLDLNHRFDILQDQVGVGTQQHEAWIIGYILN